MDNPTPQTGIYNQYQPDILMVPRRPVNLYYNVTTPSQWTGEYNSIYHSYWGRDLSYGEILDKESDVLVQYMLRGEIDPWMFHQTNLRAYDGVHTLLGDLLDRTLDKYGSLFVLPARSLTHAALGEWMANRMRYNAAGIVASIKPDQGTLTITASQSAVVPVTGLCTASSETYGGQCVSHVSLSAGQTVTYSIATAGSPQAARILSASSPADRGITLSASPNPFNPSTTISFTTTRAGHVTAKIYDVSGHLVRTLADRTLEGGLHTLPWNGSTENGARAASGVYFVKLRAPDGKAAKCLVLMK